MESMQLHALEILTQISLPIHAWEGRERERERERERKREISSETLGKSIYENLSPS